MTVKVTASYQFDDNWDYPEFEFDDTVTQKEIEDYIENDFWSWVASQFSYGFSIEKIERTNENEN